MKLVLVLEDEAWFWVHTLNDRGYWVWEASYEEGETPAIRLHALDRVTLEGVVSLIHDMADVAESEILNAADASLNK